MKVQAKDLSQNENGNTLPLASTKTVHQSEPYEFTFFVLHTTRRIHEGHQLLIVLVCNQA